MKPIVGRCGANIRIYSKNDQLCAETDGEFDGRDMMYQQLAPLPVVADLNVQLSAFSVAVVTRAPVLVLTSRWLSLARVTAYHFV